MFDIIKSFLLEHWEALLSVFLCVLSFVLALIRKKPVLNKSAIYLNQLLTKIPLFIDLVEESGASGDLKKQEVMALCAQFLSDNFGFNDFDVFEEIISEHIESVLTTPQKKNKEV